MIKMKIIHKSYIELNKMYYINMESIFNALKDAINLVGIDLLFILMMML